MSLAGSYNGLSFGPSTKVHVSGHQGIADLAEMRQSDVLKGNRFGSFKGVDLMGQRAVILDLAIIGDDHSDFLTQYAAVEAATAPLSDPTAELPLYLFGSTKVLFCRPRHRTMPTETDHFQRTGVCSVEFIASDPRIYDATLQQTSVGANIAAGGVKFSVKFSLAFTGGSGSPGIIQAQNAGSLTTYPVVTIQGPCTTPTIWNDAAGVYIAFNITLASTDTLVVDMLERTVVLNGTASRRSTRTSGSTWWGLAPNSTSQIRFTAASATGSTLTLAWRSAWSGATA